MDGWDLALLAAAGYVAAMALARLMLRRRNQLVEELLNQAEHQRRPGKPASASEQGGPKHRAA